jgi:hypothetical protein
VLVDRQLNNALDCEKKINQLLKVDKLEFWQATSDKAGELDKAFEPKGGFEKGVKFSVNPKTNEEAAKVDKLEILMAARAEGLEYLKPVQMFLINQVSCVVLFFKRIVI